MTKPAIRVNAYRVLSDCVERGAHYGVVRGLKHLDHGLTEAEIEAVVHRVVQAVLNEACDYFTFDGPEES